MLSLPQLGWGFIALTHYFLLFYFYGSFPCLQKHARSLLMLFQFWKQTTVMVERFPELIVKRCLSYLLSLQNKILFLLVLQNLLAKSKIFFSLKAIHIFNFKGTVGNSLCKYCVRRAISQHPVFNIVIIKRQELDFICFLPACCPVIAMQFTRNSVRSV